MTKKTLKTMLFSSALALSIGTARVGAEELEPVIIETDTVVLAETADSPELVPVVEDTSAETFSEPSFDEEHQVTVEEYREQVSGFQELTIGEVYQVFTEDNQEHALYFGRETCYHCRQLSPELHAFNDLIDGQLKYYSTISEDFDEQAATFVFETIGIPGVPTVLRVQDGQILSGWVGGGITGQELYDYLYLGQVPERFLGENDQEQKTADTTSEQEISVEVNATDSEAEQPSLSASEQTTAVTNKLDHNTETVTLTVQSLDKEVIKPTTIQGLSAGRVQTKKETGKGQSIAKQKLTTGNTLPQTGEQGKNRIKLGLFVLLASGLLGLNKQAFSIKEVGHDQ